LNAVKLPEHQVYLSLGSNIQPEKHLLRAIELLRWAVKVERISCAWQTPSVGAVGPDFINVVVLVKTSLNADRLKKRLLRPIETRLGRVRTGDKFAARTIDVDILMIDDEVMDQDIWSQTHLAVPLAELLPGYAHPVSGETLTQISTRLAQIVSIRPRPDLFHGVRDLR